MIIMGLDIATHCGVAVLSEGVIVHRDTIFYEPQRKGASASDPGRYQRYAKYATAVEDLLTQWAITHVYVEGYGFANKHTMATLVELGALIREVLHESDARWEEVAPSRLKKFVTGKGNSPKDRILLDVYKRFGLDCKTDDEADAVGLAYYGWVAHGGQVDLPKAQLDVALGLDKRKLRA